MIQTITISNISSQIITSQHQNFPDVRKLPKYEMENAKYFNVIILLGHR